MKEHKKHSKTLNRFKVFGAAALSIFLSVSGVSLSETLVNAEDGVGEVKTVFVNFSDESQKDLFDAYYSADGETATKVDFDDYWEIKDGKLYGKADGGYSSLIFKDYGLMNYEMSADYASEGSGYGVLLSKMRRKGVSSRASKEETYREYGHGVFVENGEAVMQGDFRCMGSSPDAGIKKKKLIGYDATKEHNIFVRCFNDEYEMKIDGVSAIQTIGGGGIGFMGIQTVGGKGVFDNIRIKMLDYNGQEKDILPDDDIIRVACVGDSLTYGSSKDGYDSAQNTPGFLQKMLGNGYDVRNFGLGGRTAIEKSGSCIMYCDGSFTDLSAEYEMAVKYKADIIYVMLGTNDSQTTSGYWGNDLEEGALLFEQGYQKVLDGLTENNPNAKIYLLIPPTYRHKSLPQLTEEMIATRARTYVPEIAKKNGLTVIDANAVTKDLDTSHLFDYIHFDPYGYSLIAGAVYDRIASDSNETLTVGYGEEGITLKIGEKIELKQTSVTNPRWIVLNDKYAVKDDNVLSAIAAGETVVNAILGEQKISVKLRVENNFEIGEVKTAKSSLTYGEDLPELTVNAPVKGQIAFADGELPQMGENSYKWIFTPDEAIYQPVYGEITLTYKKAVPQASAPVVDNVEFKNGMKLSDVSLPDGYRWETPENGVKEGKNSAVAVYVVEDTEHYENPRFEITFRAIATEKDQSPILAVLYTFMGVVIGGAAAFGVAFLIKRLRKGEN